MSITILILLAGSFWYVKEHKTEVAPEQEITKNDDLNDQNPVIPTNVEESHNENEDLVWYEIPELNIKFEVYENIINLVDCRSFYVENTKANGCELFIVDFYDQYNDDSKNADSFASLMVYELDVNGSLVNGPRENTSWNVICSKDNVILKTKDRLICYVPDTFSHELNVKNGNYDRFNPSVKEIFDGYFVNVLAEEMQLIRVFVV